MTVALTRSCEACGIDIGHRGPRATTCSQRCNVARWRARDAEKARADGRASMARFRQAHPERAKAAALAQRQKTREECRLRAQAWRDAHPERSRAAARDWAARNRVRRALIQDARRTREHANGIYVVTMADWDALVRRYRGRCAYCGSGDGTLQRDHVVPISRGGQHSIGNLLPACRRCNCSKKDRTIMEWRRSRRRSVKS